MGIENTTEYQRTLAYTAESIVSFDPSDPDQKEFGFSMSDWANMNLMLFAEATVEEALEYGASQGRHSWYDPAVTPMTELYDLFEAAAERYDWVTVRVLSAMIELREAMGK